MILNILNIHNVYGCSQLHLIWLANHSGLVQKAAGDLEPGQTRYGWWQRGWGELFYCHRQCLPKTLKTMPKTLKTKTTPKTLKCPIKQQFKATTLLGSRPVYCNCLLDFSIRVPQIPPTDSTPPGAFAASVNGFMFVQAFKSEACVSSWDSLFLITYFTYVNYYIWLSINSTFRSARVSCSAPSLKCYSISPAWLTHLAISTIAHVTHSPQAC